MTKRKGGLPVEKPPVPDFAPVPRKYRYDGWTPERQKAFIEALAETGSVTRAAAQVNMAQANCYTLRRAPGAEEFRRAWDAALDFGVKRLKDIAFERAIDGYLVPVFVAGKLMGFRRKHNDKLLMFCLRHYGQDANGKRTTINYFSSRASAGAAAGVAGTVGPEAHVGRPSTQPVLSAAAGGVDGLGTNESDAPRTAAAQAEAATTTVQTIITGAGSNGDGAEALDRSAAVLNGFEGVALDDEARSAIAAALEAYAARVREARAMLDAGGEAAADAGEAFGHDFIRVGPNADPYRGTMESGLELDAFVPFTPGEAHWELAGADKPAELVRIQEQLAAKEAAARAAANDDDSAEARKRRANGG